jgi:hypothetical protein
MTVTPPRRKNRTLFWISTILIVSAVAATVLLANNMRNLQAVAQRYHFTWFDHQEKVVPKVVASKPMAKLNRLETRVPNQFFKAASSAPGAFVRTWRQTGDSLCAKLEQAGVAVGRWEQSAPGATTFECTNAPVGAAETSDTPSLVVTARGTFSQVTDVRVKVVVPFTPAGMAVRDRFLSVVAMLIDQTRWLDLKASVASISRLENVAQPAFGAKLTFFHEYNNIRRCTLLLELQSQTPQERLASAYFEKVKWFPLPPAELSR